MRRPVETATIRRARRPAALLRPMHACARGAVGRTRACGIRPAVRRSGSGAADQARIGLARTDCGRAACPGSRCTSLCPETASPARHDARMARGWSNTRFMISLLLTCPLRAPLKRPPAFEAGNAPLDRAPFWSIRCRDPVRPRAAAVIAFRAGDRAARPCRQPCDRDTPPTPPRPPARAPAGRGSARSAPRRDRA